MPEIYKGRGNSAMREDYIDFINYVFGFNGTKDDFVKLLPKLYKPEYLPCENNYVVTEDGKLKAAIGVYPRELDVMGTKLKFHGVGNVAVHPYSRSKGYMRELLGTGVLFASADGSGGIRILGDWYRPANLFILPPGAFLTLGFLVALFNYLRRRASKKASGSTAEKEAADD